MHDVAIVGAGPVGLFLASELGLAGCSVLVLEGQSEPGSPWKAAPLGFRGLYTGSIEVFYRRGLPSALLKEDRPAGFMGHVGGIPIDPARIGVAALPFRRPGRCRSSC